MVKQKEIKDDETPEEIKKKLRAKQIRRRKIAAIVAIILVIVASVSFYEYWMHFSANVPDPPLSAIGDYTISNSTQLAIKWKAPENDGGAPL